METKISVSDFQDHCIKRVNYDPEADALSVALGSLKSDITIEFTEHILVDMTNDGKFVGIEILDASEEISKMFSRIVDKNEIKQLLCEIRQEPNNEYLIQFRSPRDNQLVNLIIPLYKGPIV